MHIYIHRALAKSTKSRNPDSSVHLGTNPKSPFEFVLRDSEESEFLDLADCHTVINSDILNMLVHACPKNVRLRCFLWHSAEEHDLFDSQHKCRLQQNKIKQNRLQHTAIDCNALQHTQRTTTHKQTPPRMHSTPCLQSQTKFKTSRLDCICTSLPHTTIDSSKTD